MGNCCGGGEVDERKNLTSNGRHAFQGEVRAFSSEVFSGFPASYL